MHHFNDIYPFPAIVGQEQMKLALILNAINPRIGGVLIRGEKGTAKSTAARALARLLPDRLVVEGCPFGCDPADSHGLCPDCQARPGPLPSAVSRMRVVELPVSATEDKVVGSLDIEHAIKKGEKKFEPGILAEAHRNILYVDEVNLLNDHIVDVLLDAAAMGMNFIEREGVSYAHPSAFILIGTMNPEEGELRPQLLDRFGLCVDIEGIRDPVTRVDVIKRRQAYEQDPAGFVRAWEAETGGIRQRIVRAQEILDRVDVSDEILLMIARICIDMAVDGHRADITMLRTACTLAAWHGRTGVTEEDVREAAALVLPHRMRRKPFSDQQMDKEKVEQSIRSSRQDEKKHEHPPPPPPQQTENGSGNALPDGSATMQFGEGAPFALDRRALSGRDRPDFRQRQGRGRRNPTESRDGRYVGSRIMTELHPDIALDATIRAAATGSRENPGGLAISIRRSDLREKVREKKTGSTTLFVVDASGSMGAQQRMTEVKGAILSLLIDAYQKRDRVGLVAFRGRGAEVLLPPTASVELAREYLRELPVGGKTPLAHGLSLGLDVLVREQKKDRDTLPRLILISDGKGNVGLGPGGSSPLEDARTVASHIRDAGIPSFVIDSDASYLSFGMARRISEDLGARYLRLGDLRSDRIADAVRGMGM